MREAESKTERGRERRREEAMATSRVGREVGGIGIHGGPSILDLVRYLAAANCGSDTLTSPPHTVSKRATVLIGLNCVRDGRGN